MRIAVVAALLLCATTAARAADAPAKSAAPAYMDMQPIGMPAVIGGRLVNYVFVDIRLLLAGGQDAARMQTQEPALRDRLVRAATHTPFNLAGDGVHLDHARLQAEVLRDAAAVYGPGRVRGVELRSETPQRRTGVPGGSRD